MDDYRYECSPRRHSLIRITSDPGLSTETILTKLQQDLLFTFSSLNVAATWASLSTATSEG